MEDKNYHESLKSLKLYSLERRRERYMLINTWQQLEEQKENLMDFEINDRSRHRTIKTTRGKLNRNSKNWSIIYNSPALKIGEPGELRDTTGVTLDIFKRKLDK